MEIVDIYSGNNNMTNSHKSAKLKEMLSALMEYRNKLTVDNINDFNELKKGIIELLDDNQRIRFLQIRFFYERNEDIIMEQDDLPF